MVWITELNPQTCARLPGQRSAPSLLLVPPPLGAEPVGTIAAIIMIINQINKADCVNGTLGVCLLYARRRCSAVSFFPRSFPPLSPSFRARWSSPPRIVM